MNNRIAFLFHGIVGGLDGRNGAGRSIDLDTCSKVIKHHNKDYQIDYFVHSWSTEFREKILTAYNPTNYLFEEQEKFGLSLNMQDEHQTHAFRILSRYASLEKAVELKKEYELHHNFKYKWVVITRFDLILFNQLEFNLDPNYFYIPFDPLWPNALNDEQNSKVHDVIFFSNSENIDKFAIVSREILTGRWDHILYANVGASGSHMIVYQKLKEVFPGLVRYGTKRYIDFEIYRMITQPELNPEGHIFGALEMKQKMIDLLKKID